VLGPGRVGAGQRRGLWEGGNGLYGRGEGWSSTEATDSGEGADKLGRCFRERVARVDSGASGGVSGTTRIATRNLGDRVCDSSGGCGLRAGVGAW
jgi:hypothetical protein